MRLKKTSKKAQQLARKYMPEKVIKTKTETRPKASFDTHQTKAWKVRQLNQQRLVMLLLRSFGGNERALMHAFWRPGASLAYKHALAAMDEAAKRDSAETAMSQKETAEAIKQLLFTLKGGHKNEAEKE